MTTHLQSRIRKFWIAIPIAILSAALPGMTAAATPTLGVQATARSRVPPRAPRSVAKVKRARLADPLSATAETDPGLKACLSLESHDECQAVTSMARLAGGDIPPRLTAFTERDGPGIDRVILFRRLMI